MSEPKKTETTIHPACLSLESLEKQCRFQRTRRSGPGGQHRNKVESAVVVTHEPSGIVAEANERRSQHENRAVALGRLRIKLAINMRTAWNKDTHPSELWNARVSGRRISVSPEHHDFPAILAEALNVLDGSDFDIIASAKALNVSPSQLIKLLKVEPDAFLLLNAARAKKNLGKLK